MAYTTLALAPADGSKLSATTDPCADMISATGETTITFKKGLCHLNTEKGTHVLTRAQDGHVYYATIGRWYVCYNGAELCWRANSN